MKSERQFFPTVLKALKNFFTKNIPVKLIALSFAVLLWAYVIANQNPERIKTIENVAVTTTGDADMAAKNLVVRGDLSELLGTVDIRVSTDVVHYKDVDENTVTASINLSSVTGDGVTMLKVQASTSIGTIESITPSTITLEIDKLAKKNIPIVCNTVGTLDSSYYMQEPIMDKTHIEIVGASKDVHAAAYAAFDIVLDDITGSIRRSYELTLYDESGNALDVTTSALSETPSVMVLLNVLPTKRVPVNLGSVLVGTELLPEIYSIEQILSDRSFVTIAAEQALLDTIPHISLTNIDLGGRTNSFVETTTLKLPHNVILVGGDPNVNVTVVISEKKQTVTLSDLAIGLSGAQDRFNYTYAQNTISIEMEAPISLLAAYNNGDFVVAVNADVSAYTQSGNNVETALVPSITVMNSNYLFLTDSQRLDDGRFMFVLYRLLADGTEKLGNVYITLPFDAININVSKR